MGRTIVTIIRNLVSYTNPWNWVNMSFIPVNYIKKKSKNNSAIAFFPLFTPQRILFWFTNTLHSILNGTIQQYNFMGTPKGCFQLAGNPSASLPTVPDSRGCPKWSAAYRGMQGTLGQHCLPIVCRSLGPVYSWKLCQSREPGASYSCRPQAFSGL